MGQLWIDAVARRLATGLSRRRFGADVSAALAAASTSTFLLNIDVAEAGCKKPGKKCKKTKDCCNGATCKGKHCKCKSGRDECDGDCVNLDSDASHCGTCGNACAGDEHCDNGACIADDNGNNNDNGGNGNNASEYVYAGQWGGLGPDDGEFNYPAGLAISPYDIIHVADLDNNRVQIFDTDGGFLGWFGTIGESNGQFTHPLRVAIAPDDAIYVTDGSDRCQRFDLGGNFQLAWDGSEGAGKFGNPRGVVITANGDVFVADTENNRIQKFEVDGTFLMSFGAFGHAEGELSLPAGLAIDGDGNLVIADSFNHRVQTFDTDGNFLSSFGGYGDAEGELDFPHSVAIAANGDIFVADTGNNRIQKFTADGDFILAFGSEGSGDGELHFPEGVALASNGDVFVADTGNDRIVKFAPS